MLDAILNRNAGSLEEVVVLLPKEVPDFGFLLMLKEERLELKG
jgi:hypothetical protein